MTSEFKSEHIRVTSPDGLHTIDYWTSPYDVQTPRFFWDSDNNVWADHNPPPPPLPE